VLILAGRNAGAGAQLEWLMRAGAPIFDWVVPAALVGVAFVFGLVDDAYGGADARGFRGHLAALRRGRLTTGGLKVVGIGAAAAVFAVSARAVHNGGAGVFAGAPGVAEWIAATLVIALSANLVNLTDLRPGRALKAYTALALVGTVAGAVTLSLRGVVIESMTATVGAAVALSLGPVLAVWRYDLGEKGMLGDAGANAMGALAGYLLASSLPLWGLAIAAAVLLLLNLASEKVSFSAVIDRNGLLRWVDGLGRVRDTSGVPGRDAARTNGADDGKDGEAS
jgi:UDP-GlcNAc:undecaprenyl-phosphate GlcNAc-1-phosphate transferase